MQRTMKVKKRDQTDAERLHLLSLKIKYRSQSDRCHIRGQVLIIRLFAEWCVQFVQDSGNGKSIAIRYDLLEGGLIVMRDEEKC